VFQVEAQTGADGEGGGVIGLIGALAGRVDAYTGRAVGKDGSRDAQPGNGRGGACGSCHEVGLAANDGSCSEEVVCTANE